MPGIRIVCTLLILWSIAASSMAQDIDILGQWYLKTFKNAGITIFANEFRHEELVITKDHEKIYVANIRKGPLLQLTHAANAKASDASFYIAGTADNSEKYRLAFTDNGRMRLLSAYGPELEDPLLPKLKLDLEFSRHQPSLAPLSPAVRRSGDLISFESDWARQYWYKGFDARFRQEHGHSFAACFSDPECLRPCDGTHHCTDLLHDKAEDTLNDMQDEDPLFVDNIAGAAISELTYRRQQLLSFKATMKRHKDQSLLAYRDTTLKLLADLTVDGSPKVPQPADNDDYYRQALEVIGCTAGGFVPLVDDLASIGCGVSSLANLKPGDITAANNGSISIADLFHKLITVHDNYHDEMFDKWNQQIDAALKDEKEVFTLYKEIQETVGMYQPSEAKILDSVFDAVWPYAFFLLGESYAPVDITEIPGSCLDKIKIFTDNPFIHVKPNPDDWALSLHHALNGTDFFYKKRSSKKSILYRWTLNIGTIDNYHPLGAAAMEKFRAYLRRNSRSVLGILLDSHRIYVQSPYQVRRHVAPQINHVNPNYVAYEPDPPAIMIWPSTDERNKPTDTIGYIRKSIHGRAGRTVMPHLHCYQEL